MLARLHRHSEALRLILHTEADLPKAYRYCDEVNERQKTMMRKRKTIVKGGEKEGKDDEEEGDEVYLILLEV